MGTKALLIATLLFVLPGETLRAASSFRMSLGWGTPASKHGLRGAARCHCWDFCGPGGWARFHHRRLGSGFVWSTVDLIERWGGRWHDCCPRCSSALFLREDRPYCPRCVLRFRIRPCSRCGAPLLLGVMDLAEPYRAPPVHRQLEAHAPEGSLRAARLEGMREGLEHLQAGRWAEGALSFRRAIRERPEDPVALLYWALALGAGGESHRAGRIMRRVAQRFPALVSTELDMAALLGGAERLVVIEKRIEAEAKEENGRFFLAAFLHLSGKRVRSRTLFRRLAGELPEAARFVSPGRRRP